MERDFIFVPDNIDDNPDNDVQEIIQDRIKALSLLTTRIQELTQNYISRNENNNTTKTKNDGMSDLTMDETENYIQEANVQTLQNNLEKDRNNQGKNSRIIVSLEQFKQHDMRYTVLTDSEKPLLKLYKLCINNNVPQDMFDGIIKIFHDAYIANEESFNEMFQHTRVSLAKKIESLFPGGEP